MMLALVSCDTAVDPYFHADFFKGLVSWYQVPIFVGLCLTQKYLGYIMPPIMFGSIAGAGAAGSGLLATTASVVKIRLATEAAF